MPRAQPEATEAGRGTGLWGESANSTAQHDRYKMARPSRSCPSAGHLRDRGTCPCHHTPWLAWPGGPGHTAAHPTRGTLHRGIPLPLSWDSGRSGQGAPSGPLFPWDAAQREKNLAPHCRLAGPCVTSIRGICCPEAAGICLRSISLGSTVFSST